MASSTNRVSSTYLLELQPVHTSPQQRDAHLAGDGGQTSKPLSSILGRIPRKVHSKDRSQVAASESRARQAEDRNETLPPPSVVVEEPLRWNSPKINAFRTFATFWSFIIMGLNDGAYGVSPQ